jgi:hypothetical protein
MSVGGQCYDRESLLFNSLMEKKEAVIKKNENKKNPKIPTKTIKGQVVKKQNNKKQN